MAHTNSLEQTRIVLGFLIILVSCICGLTLVYYGYKFYQLRHEMFIKKRRGNIVLIYTFCSIMILLFGLPLSMYLHFDWSIMPSEESTLYIVLDVINDIVYSPWYYFGGSFSLLRYWLIYYDIQFSNSCINLEWKQVITQNIEILKQEKWYISHKKTLGNAAYLSKWFVTICTIISIFVLVSVNLWTFGVINIMLFPIINILVFFLMLLSMILIWRNMPKFNDHIFLHREFKTISYGWSTAFFLYSLSHTIRFIVGSHTLFTLFLENIAGVFGTFIVPFLSTFWVLKQRKSSEFITFLNLSQVTSASPEVMTLQKILLDTDMINAFAQHLLEEFSIECLLSLIEFSQFRHYVMETFDINFNQQSQCDHDTNDHDVSQSGMTVTITQESGSMTDSSLFMSFADSVPRSDIVYSELGNDLNAFKAKAFKLYKKYVKQGTHFEINISWEKRLVLHNIFDNCDELMKRDDVKEKELAIVFDDCILEMVGLLNSSKARFKYLTPSGAAVNID